MPIDARDEGSASELAATKASAAARTTKRALGVSIVPAVLAWLVSLLWAPGLVHVFGAIYGARSALTALIGDAMVLLLFLLGFVASRALAAGGRRAPALALARGLCAVPGALLGALGIVAGVVAFVFFVVGASERDLGAQAASAVLAIVGVAQLAAEVMFVVGAVRAWAGRSAFVSGPAEPRSTAPLLTGAGVLLFASLVLQAVANDATPPAQPVSTHQSAGSSWGWGGR